MAGCDPMPNAPLDKGLEYALCALAFYRHRNDRRPMYRKSKRTKVPMVSDRDRYAAMCRSYVRKARAFGWRGSVHGEVYRLSQGR